MDQRIEEGVEFLQSVFYETAYRIVTLAIKVYNLDFEQAAALRDVYLRTNDYQIMLREI